MTATTPPPGPRTLLRRGLLARRAAFAAEPAHAAAEATLAAHLGRVLELLEPALLGLYMPYRGEFNAASALRAAPVLAKVALALPFAQREPRCLHYRGWDGGPSIRLDDCGIPTGEGPEVVPDVVLVPCVGYTDTGFRLGYGGGYFDRWLDAYPAVTAVGVAWSGSRLDAGEFAAQPHDRPLTLIVTERGVVRA